MGRPKSKNPRNIQRTIKLTIEENEQILSDMSAFGYVSFSRYIRSTILHKTKYKSRGKVKDRELLYRIDTLSKRIQEIGRNYNQIVASYNRLHQARALTIPIVDEHIHRLELLTERVYELQNQIIDNVDEMNLNTQTE